MKLIKKLFSKKPKVEAGKTAKAKPVSWPPREWQSCQLSPDSSTRDDSYESSSRGYRAADSIDSYSSSSYSSYSSDSGSSCDSGGDSGGGGGCD